MVIGSEWVVTDTTQLHWVDSREWELESRYYGSDLKRIKQPFD